MSKYLSRGERVLFTISALIAITCATIILHWRADGAVSPGETWRPPARTHWMKTPCANEEFSTNCTWNAHLQGNGQGVSFYVANRPLYGPQGHRVGHVVCVYHVPRQSTDGCHIKH